MTIGAGTNLQHACTHARTHTYKSVICNARNVVHKLESEARYTHAYTHTHTTILRPSWILSRTTWVSWHQKGKTHNQEGKNQSGFTGARDSEWQLNQLGHMQSCTLTQTHNHASFFTGGMPFLPPNQQRQSTEGMHTTST